MANRPATIGNPTSASLREDVSVDASGNINLNGTISISDPDAGQAAFQTTVIAAAGVLGTLTLAANGSYTYSVSNSDIQYLGASDTKIETFTISSVDGTTKNVSFTIRGANDVAAIGAPTVTTVAEDTAVDGSGNLQAAGTISIFDADQNQTAFQTTVTAANGTLGSLVLAADGSYSYTVANSAVQYLGAGDTKIENFTIKAVDGTSKTVSFTIAGQNDDPVIGTPTATDVTEDVNVGGNGKISVVGSISISDADTGEASFKTQVTAAPGTLGSLVLSTGGNYTYSVSNSAAGYLKAGETKVETFTIRSTDGTTKDISFTIHGSDDAAVIGNPSVSLVKEDVSVDGAGNIKATGTISVTDADAGQSSFQTTVVAAAGTLGNLVLASDGSYTYTVANSAVQYLGASDTKTETFTVTSLDGTTKDITFTIKGANDAAAIGAPTVATVTEDSGVDGSGNVTAAGTISIFDADQGQSAFQTTVTSAAGTLGSLVLAADGSYIYSVANSAIQYLGAGDTKTETFTIKAADGTSKSVSFIINGQDDPPSIGTPTVADVTEDVDVNAAGKLTAAGTISISDADTGESGFKTQVTSAAGNLGSLSLAADGHYTYSVANSAAGFLRTGETKVDTFTIQTKGGTTTDVSFTIHGSDDAAVIGNPTVSSVREDSAVDTSGNLNAIGHISVIDADAGQSSFQTSVVAASGTLGTLVLASDGSYTYSVANNLVQFLGANDTKVETFTVTSADGTAKDVSFTIRGTNDAAVIGAPTATTVHEDTAVDSFGNLAATGSISVSDVDQNQSSFQTAVTAAAGTLGSLVIATDGSYTYSVANSDVQYLGTGDTKVDTFTIRAADGTGKTIKFTITGSNDAAVIGTPSAADVTEDVGVDGNGNLTAVGTISVVDADAGESTFKTQVTAAAGTLGSLVLATNGSYTYSVSNSAVQSLNTGDTKIENFTVKSFDGTTSIVSFTIHGANEGPTIITGTSGPDTLVGTSGADVISGLGGDDILQGLGGDDTLDGGAGRDAASYADATGGITVDMASGLVSGPGIGNDTLRSVESVIGSAYNDTYVATGFNTASANSPSDAIPVPASINQFEGGAGDDTIVGNGQSIASYLHATAGVTVDVAAGTGDGDASVGHDTFTGVNQVRGSAYNDSLYGSNNSTLIESFIGGAGDDYIDGRGGFDRAIAEALTFDQVTAGVSINMAAGTIDGDSSVGHDTLRSIESARGTHFADTYDATGFGLAGAANVGNNGTFNSFEGMGGNDTIIGNGNTQLTFFSWNTASDATGVTVDIQAGTVDGDSTVGHDTFTGVNSVSGSIYADTLLGSNNGSGTSETFNGGAGDDYIDGRGGFDVADYNNVQGTVSGVHINMAAGIAAGDAIIGTDTLRSIESVRGTAFDDVYDASGFGSAGAANIGNNGTFNQFQGNGGNDTIIGNGNTQLVYFGAASGVAADLAAGTATGDASVGTDTFTGVNSITGSNFDDTISGDGGNNQLNGGAGNDTLAGRGGNDVLTGSLGSDRFVIENNNGIDTVTDFQHGQGDLIDLSGVSGIYSLNDVLMRASQTGTNTFIDFGNGNTLTLNNVNLNSLTSADFAFGTPPGSIAGTSGPDVLTGTAGNDTIYGLQSNDELHGLAGDDTLVGGDGDDLLDGGTGRDFAIYTDATGGVIINLAAGTVSGPNVGNDTLRGVEGVFGSAYADTYDASGFSSTSTNAATEDVIPVSASINQFEGGAGNDSITGNGQTLLSYLTATSGVTADIQLGVTDGDASVGHDTYTGVSQLRGSAFNDTLLGSNNTTVTETFIGEAGDDFIDGRGGFDRVVAEALTLNQATSGVTIHMAAGTLDGDASVGHDTFRSIEGTRGTHLADTYDATGFGLAGAANVGNNGTFNSFEGRGGDDTITGNGNTQIAFFTATGGVTVDIAAGTVDGDASVGHDTFTGVNGVSATNYADTLFGSNNANGTTETFAGSGGDDFIDGRGGFDISDYSNNTATVSGVHIDLGAGTATGDASAETDTLRSIEGARGTNFADVYDASGYGVAGAANVGNNGTFNQFQGNAGNDTIIGNGNTQLVYFGATSGVTADLTAGTATGDASVGTDTFTGVNALTGSNFNDTLSGDAGANRLDGGFGNDTLAGRGGNDILTGGAGADRFVVEANNGIDTIIDFQHSQADVIDLTGVSGVYSLNDVLARASQLGANTFIDFGNGNTLTLNNVTLTNLTSQDFAFAVSPFITGTNGPDTLVGTSGFDVISGLGGNDIVQGLGGDDTLDGGAGFDTASYADATGGVTINLAAGTASGSGVGNDTLTSIEAAIGSDYADTFDATGYNPAAAPVPGMLRTYNVFEGGRGDDTIIGNFVAATGGYSTGVSYEHASDGVTVDLGAGTGHGTAAGDVAGVGNDTFVGVVSTVIGSNFADNLTGGSVSTIEQFEGRGGADFINGGSNFDTAIYQSESQAIVVNLAAGTVTGGDGNDTLRSIEQIRGTQFNDTFNATGFSGTSVNAGSSGTFNEFEGLGGNDTITGNGNTRVSYQNATAAVTVDLVAGTGQGTATGDVAGVGVDTFTGVNQIKGSAFDDTLLGSAGGDTFDGRAGDDFIDGRGGFDTVVYNTNPNLASGVAIDLASGVVTGDAFSGTDTLRSIEQINGSVYADTYNATGFGQVGAANVGSNGVFNTFQGFGGDDTITGNGFTQLAYFGANAAVTVDIQAGTGHGTAAGDVASVGNDTFTGVNALVGSNFNDTLLGSNNAAFTTETFEGRAGNDFIDGRGGFDLAVYGNDPAVTSGIAVNLAAGTVTGSAAIGTDTLQGVEAIRGTNFADTFNASGFGSGSTNAGSLGTLNEFEGLGGNDTITGNGDTRIIFSSATAGVTVDIAAGTASGNASVGNDTFTGVSRVRGSNFNDTVGGDAGNNILEGQGGVDTVTYASATSAVSVDLSNTAAQNTIGAGTDTLTGFENLTGSAFADTLKGTAGANTIAGGAGDDLLIGGEGDDALDGGAGFDTASYTDATAGVTINLAAGTASGSGIGNDTLTSIEAATGSNFADTFDATGYNPSVAPVPGMLRFYNVFEGRGGDDIITGNFVASAGGYGTGVSYASAADGVTVNLGAGTGHGTAAGDLAGVGNDTFIGVVSTVIGSNFADNLTGGSVSTIEQFEGRGGADFINGGSNFDTAIYQSESQAIVVNLAAGTVTGGDGNDTLRSIEQIRGTQFNDTFNATGFNGGSVNAGSSGTFNEFEGLGGNDTVTGNGNTRISYQNAQAAVTVDLVAGTGQGTAAGDVAGVGVDTFTGTNLITQVRGSAFDDTLLGSNVNDTLDGRAGNDLLDGRGGFDTAAYNTNPNSLSGISVDMASGIVTGDAFNGTDTLRSIEQVSGTNFADTYTAVGFGVAGAANVGSLGSVNQFQGFGGDDTITGNGATLVAYLNANAAVTADIQAGTGHSIAAGDTAGVGNDTFTGVNGLLGSGFNDTLFGSNNAAFTTETFEGRAGNDLIDGRGGFDQAVYGNDPNVGSGITVNLAAGTVTGPVAVGTDTLQGIESIRGTNFADSFNASGFGSGSTNAGSLGTLNEFEGLGGNDTITGNGDTRIAFTNATAAVTVDLAAGTASGNTSVGTDTFTGVSRVRGSNFNDTISGDSSNNVLEGQAGNDTLNGRAGNDTLTGGTGNDTFVFATFSPASNANAGNTNFDVVTDYLAGADHFDLSALGLNGQYSALVALMTESGGNVTITVDQSNQLTINATTIAFLNQHQLDFII